MMEVVLPPLGHAAYLVASLEGAGRVEQGGMGIAPLSPTTLRNWSECAGMPMGPIDFQDVLDASRAYVAAYNRFNGKHLPAPWAPEIEDYESAEAEIEKMMDRAMGLT